MPKEVRDRRRALLLAALAAVRVTGLGAIVVGMQRHGYDVTLTHDRNGWRTTFLHRSHDLYGQVLHWWPTSWRAVQEGAWRALNTPFALDYSLSEETPRQIMF